MDFVLWKPSKPKEPGWPSPAGIVAPGRPGWHIECSAMSMAELLEPFGGGLACDDPAMNVFDIHGGGVDLVFPHHENEIAQSCSAFGSARMANVWMHNGFLQVESEKMSKSLGNFVTIRELLDTGTFGGRKWPGEVLRLAMLRTHYRQPIDWTVKALEETEATLDRWYDAAGAVLAGEVAPSVIEALSDDLNTPAVIGQLHELARAGSLSEFRASLDFLGLSSMGRNVEVKIQGADTSVIADQVTAIVFRHAANGPWSATDEGIQKRIDALIDKRKVARRAKNWTESDRLREELATLGVALKDNKDGSTTWEPKR
jgi:cysteinyl-tRNA synthetase